MKCLPTWRKLLLLPLAILLLLNSYAQQNLRTISGTVKDDAGVIPGASVLVSGKNRGAIADKDGRFSIQTATGDSLLIKAVGHDEKWIVVGADNAMEINLVTKSATLKDVVVVGYGTQVRRNVTGAITKVNLKETQDLPNTNVFQAIRGRVAGVQFSDAPRAGAGGSVLIRGPRSLSGSNDPLIILDGIIFNAGIQNINPNDIATMEVLKDASAAAIYGSRAANGVILITSRKGTTEKPNFRINAFSGIGDRAHKVKLLTPSRYEERMRDYNMQAGLPASQPSDYLYPSEIANKNAGLVRDHWDLVSQDSRVSSVDLSISGRSNRTNYYISGSYVNDQGLALNDQMKRFTLRTNIENQITDWLSIGISSTYIRRDESGQIPAASSNIHPYSTPFYSDGEPQQYLLPEDQVSQASPIYPALLTKNERIINNLFTNFYGIVKFPLKGLTYRVNYSPNVRWDHTYSFFRQDKHLTTNTTSASKYNQQNFDWVFENILNYSKQIGRDHKFDITLLYGRDRTFGESTTASASQFGSDILGWDNLSLGTLYSNTSSAAEKNGVSSMARLNYGFKSRYLFTFTVRRDGSSVFSSNNKYATFPSGALSWIMSDESFLEKSKLVNFLKLRISYGAVGNQVISPYQSLSASGVTRYVFGDGGVSSLGIFPVRMENSNLKWETTYTANIGADFELFDSRINGTVEVYSMKTKDLLVERSLPSMTGYPSVWTNLGGTSNKGIELTLNTINIRRKDFEWSSNFIFSRNKNAIEHLYYSDANADGKEDDDINNKWFIGQPVNVAYDYVFDGVYQKGDAVPTGYKTGDARMKDINVDGVITAADRTILGQSGEPKYRWGIGNNFKYKNITLSVFINGMKGWLGAIDLAGNTLQNDRNFNRIDYGWWTAENKSNSMPSLIYTNPLGHGYYSSRNFVRIQDVSLSYEFNKDLLKKIKFSNLRVFVSGKNLATFTDWPGADPESGTDQNGIPLRRLITLGVNLDF